MQTRATIRRAHRRRFKKTTHQVEYVTEYNQKKKKKQEEKNEKSKQSTIKKMFLSLLNLERERGRIQTNEPGNPGEKEEKRDSMARFSSEISDNLWDFSDAPAKEAYESKAEGEFIFDIAEAVFEILLRPIDAWFLLLYTIRYRILDCIFHLTVSVCSVCENVESSGDMEVVCSRTM